MNPGATRWPFISIRCSSIPGCEDDYHDVVKRLFSQVSPENVVWISLGTFRFPPSLKTIIQKRFPQSKIVYGEFIPGLDGKMRYFKPLRIALYRKMAAWIREYAPQITLYFCMEDDEVWRKSLGFVPCRSRGTAADCWTKVPFVTANLIQWLLRRIEVG